MKTAASNETLLNQAISIIHSNHLTRSEINSLLGPAPSPAPRLPPNLETAAWELAELILAKGLTIQEGAELFRELAEIFNSSRLKPLNHLHAMEYWH